MRDRTVPATKARNRWYATKRPRIGVLSHLPICGILKSLSTLLVAYSLVHPAAAKTIPRIAFVAGAGGYPAMAVTNQAFFDGLAERGYHDHDTMDVVFRSAQGDMSRMPTLIAEVLAQGVDIIVVSSSPGCAAAHAATRTVPILCISVQDDPRREGVSKTLSHGTGNLVGVHSFLPDGVELQFAAISRLMPDAHKIAILFNPANGTHRRLLEDWTRVAARHNVTVVPMPVVKAADLSTAIKDAKAHGAQAGMGLLGADTYAIREEVAQAALANNFPIAMDTPGGYIALGGVAEIGVDIVPLYKRGAQELMVPMLNGTAPSTLPWLGPNGIRVATNSTSLRAFGLEDRDQTKVGNH